MAEKKHALQSGFDGPERSEQLVETTFLDICGTTSQSFNAAEHFRAALRHTRLMLHRMVGEQVQAHLLSIAGSHEFEQRVVR
jgi:hypothetical protein